MFADEMMELFGGIDARYMISYKELLLLEMQLNVKNKEMKKEKK